MLIFKTIYEILQ